MRYHSSLQFISWHLTCFMSCHHKWKKKKNYKASEWQYIIWHYLRWSFTDMYTSLHQTHASKLTSESTESKHSCLRLWTHERTWTHDCRGSATQMFQEWSFCFFFVYIIEFSLKKKKKTEYCRPILCCFA